MLSKLLRRVPTSLNKYSPLRCFADKCFCPTDLYGKVGIIGVPFGKGQNKRGKDEVGLKSAPDILRKTGFLEAIISLGFDVYDSGNVCYEPDCDLIEHNMHNLDHIAPCTKAVSLTVEYILQQHRSCLVLGGDHSVAIGSIHGHLKVADPSRVAVIYIDAHPDINTNRTSPSGNVHGMTVGLISQELQSYWPDGGVPGMEWLSPCLPLKNIAFIGTRSVDFGEARFLTSNNVPVYGIEDIDRCGIQKVLCKALAEIDPSNNKSIHVSFDIDALDSLEAPCTTAPVRGGLTLREAITVMEILHKTGRVSVIDLVEINPAIGGEIQKQTTLDAAKTILLATYGHNRKGNPKIYKN